MSDLITDAMVETAARAMWERIDREESWSEIYHASTYRRDARAALEAAAPYVAAAALDEAAAEWREIQRTDDHLLAQWLRARSARLRAQEVAR